MLLKFFLGTFALTWIAWFAAVAIPAAESAGQNALSIVRGPIFLLGVFAPAIVALTLAARADGRVGVEALIRRIGRWRVSAGWYLFAAGYMVAIKLTVALVYRITTGAWPRFGETPWPILIIAIATSTWVQAGEEIGWRGYALPRLAAHIGLAPASTLLGVIWAAWHLPLFFVLGGDTVGQSFPLYVLQVTALSIAMGWLYWRTSGSLLLVMLMHAAVNNTKDIVPSAAPGVSDPFSLSGSPVWRLTIGLLWIGAAYFLFQMRAADLGEMEAGKVGLGVG
jgi:membrane protease YdiL (CAAX protease family)